MRHLPTHPTHHHHVGPWIECSTLTSSSVDSHSTCPIQRYHQQQRVLLPVKDRSALRFPIESGLAAGVDHTQCLEVSNTRSRSGPKRDAEANKAIHPKHSHSTAERTSRVDFFIFLHLPLKIQHRSQAAAILDATAERKKKVPTVMCCLFACAGTPRPAPIHPTTPSHPAVPIWRNGVTHTCR